MLAASPEAQANTQLAIGGSVYAVDAGIPSQVTYLDPSGTFVLGVSSGGGDMDLTINILSGSITSPLVIDLTSDAFAPGLIQLFRNIDRDSGGTYAATLTVGSGTTAFDTSNSLFGGAQVLSGDYVDELDDTLSVAPWVTEHLVISSATPNVSFDLHIVGQTVPDGGSTLMLLGGVLTGLAALGPPVCCQARLIRVNRDIGFHAVLQRQDFRSCLFFSFAVPLPSPALGLPPPNGPRFRPSAPRRSHATWRRPLLRPLASVTPPAAALVWGPPINLVGAALLRRL